VDDGLFENFIQNIRFGSLQRPSSQPVAQTSASDAGNLAEARDWFSSPQIKPPAITTSPQRRPSTQNPTETLLSPPRSHRKQLHITRSEFVRTVGAIIDRFDEALNQLQDE
jgi:hypothetical protein